MKNLLFLIFTIFFITELKSQNCNCTALTYDNITRLGKMEISEREDYLLNNCFQPGREKFLDNNLSFKEFTKCNLQNMVDDDGKTLKQGDFTIKLWSDNSIQYTTRRVDVFTSIKSIVKSKSTYHSRAENIDYYKLNGFSVTCQTGTNKDSDPIYMLTFNF